MVRNQPYALLLLVLAALLPAGGTAAQPTAVDLEGPSKAILTAGVDAVVDPAGAQARLDGVIRSAPDSPLAEVAVQALLRCRLFSADARLGRERIAKLLDELPGLHGLAAARLHRAAADDAAARGDLDAWRRHLVAVKRPMHWLALGPLGDFSDDQHRVQFPVERLGIRLDRAEKGAYGPVRWRPLVRSFKEPAVRPGRGLKKAKGAWYNLLQVRSPRDRRAWLLIEARSSYEAWVNGTKVADLHAPSRDVPARMLVPATLASGWNRILVKTTDADTRDFALRIVDGRGRSLVDLEEEKGRVLHPLPRSIAPHRQAFPGPTAALAAARGPWASLLRCHVIHLLWLSSLGLAQVDAYRDDLANQPRPWRLILAEKLLNSWHLPADLRRNQARPILQGLAGGKDATSVYARINLAGMLLADQQGEKAVRMLQALLAERPGCFPALEQLDRTYRRLGWRGESRRLLARLVGRVRNGSTYRIRWARLARVQGDLPLAYERLVKAQEQDQGNLSLIRQLRRIAVAMGRLDLAEQWLDRQEVLSADRAAVLEAAAELARYAKDHGKALSTWRKLAELEPDQPRWLIEQAGLVPPVQARALYRRALAMDPANHELRRLLAALEERDWGAELAAYRTDIPKVIADFKMKKSYLESSSILVVDHMVTRVFPDGSWVNEIHQLRRINDLQGVDEHGEVDPQGDLVHLRAWQPDGSITEPIEVEGSYEIPGLKPGCFIEELSRNSYTQPLRGIREVTDFWFSRFEEDFLWTRLIVIMPKGHRGEFRWGERLPPPVVEEKGDTVVYTFDHRNMARVHKESSMPHEVEALPFTLFGEDRPAGEINRDMRERFLRGFRGSVEIDRATARICKGLEGDMAKIKAIYRWAQKEVPGKRGSSNPTSVLLKKEGERWFLIAAMLRSARIPMRFAAIHPAAPGTDTEPEPLFQNTETLSSWFSMPGLKLYPRDGSPLWILAGMPRHLPLGMIPGEFSGAPVLMLDEGGAAFDFLPQVEAASRATFVAKGVIRLTGGREAAARFLLTFPGVTGYQIKEHLTRATRDQQERFISGRLVAPLFRGATLRGFELVDGPPESPLRIQINLFYRNYLRMEGGQVAAPTGIFPARLGRMVDRPTRTWPFVCRENQVLKWQVTLDPGQEWRIKEIPRSRLSQFDFLTWDLRFHPQDNRVVVSRSLVLQPGRISPGRYSRLITVCRGIDEAEARGIPLARNP